MALRINSNVDAMAAHRHLAQTSDKISQAMDRLSSGLRINKAADDAAGLGISEKMRAQIRGLAQAQRNIQDGVSMVQTAEGNLDEVHSILQRVRELAVQYKNGSTSTAGKAAIQSEVDQLAAEINRVSGSRPRSCISSAKLDRLAMSRSRRGRRTNVPRPRVRSMRPCWASSPSARRTVIRLTP